MGRRSEEKYGKGRKNEGRVSREVRVCIEGEFGEVCGGEGRASRVGKWRVGKWGSTV